MLRRVQKRSRRVEKAKVRLLKGEPRFEQFLNTNDAQKKQEGLRESWEVIREALKSEFGTLLDQVRSAATSALSVSLALA